MCPKYNIVGTGQGTYGVLSWPYIFYKALDINKYKYLNNWPSKIYKKRYVHTIRQIKIYTTVVSTTGSLLHY